VNEYGYKGERNMYILILIFIFNIECSKIIPYTYKRVFKENIYYFTVKFD